MGFSGVRMKIVPDNVLLGQQGINLIEKIVLEMGFLWYPSGPIEAGIDGTIEIRDTRTGQVHNSIIQVQSKATSQFDAETPDSFEYICKAKDLDYWLMGNAPVILVVCRPSTGEACWVPVKEYFSDLSRRKSRKVYFDKKKDRFTADSKDQLFQTALPLESGLYLSPQRKRETLYSNLLELKAFASRIYVADSPLRKAWEVFRLLKSRGINIGSEFELRDKRIYSFHDLSADKWECVCDAGTVESFESDEWACSEIDELRDIFVTLLNRALRQMLYPRGVVYNDRWEYFWFRATPDLSPLEVSYDSLKQKTKRVVFQGYPKILEEGRRHSFYRHSAFHAGFRSHGKKWYLEITPTYAFTSDGIRRHRFSEDKLKGIKRLERNAAILGQVIMWADFLAAEPDLFQSRYPFLCFGQLMRFEVEQGINDHKWLPREADSGETWKRHEGEELLPFKDED